MPPLSFFIVRSVVEHGQSSSENIITHAAVACVQPFDRTQLCKICRRTAPIEGLRRWAKVRARLASSARVEELPAEVEGTAPPRLRQEADRNPFIPQRP